MRFTPKFATAYNNMGVAFARLGDTECERDALQRALALDDRLQLAYLNWARMDIANENFEDVDAALRKASSLDENDPTAVSLLAYTALKQGNLDEALADASKAHGMRRPHAFAHRVAARVFEVRGELDRAIAALKLSLDEEPTGALAEGARSELQWIRSLRGQDSR